jgi:RNA polymerase sigma-70 factor (ECF subfamily)
VSGISPANFTDLYQRYSRDVYRYALHLSGDAARADDLTAEAFLRIWSAAEAPRELTVRGYLLTIARNLYLQGLRRTRRESELPAEVPVVAAGIEQETDARREYARMRAALLELPEWERSALLLRAEQEMSYEEIAAALGTTPAAARVRVHRARPKLAALLNRSERHERVS